MKLESFFAFAGKKLFHQLCAVGVLVICLNVMMNDGDDDDDGGDV